MNNTYCPICQQTISMNNMTNVDSFVYNKIDHTSFQVNLQKQYEQQDQVSSILLFEPLRSIFEEVFKKDQQLNDKTNELENQFHQYDIYINYFKYINNHLNTFIDQYNNQIKQVQNSNDHLNTCLLQLTDQLNDTNIRIKTIEDQNEMKEREHINQQLTKQVDALNIQCYQLENENQLFKQKIKQLEQNYKQQNQNHIQHEHLKDTFNQQIQDLQNQNEILKQQINKLEQQSQQNNQIQIKQLENTNYRLNQFIEHIQSNTQINDTTQDHNSSITHLNGQYNGDGVIEIEHNNVTIEHQVDDQNEIDDDDDQQKCVNNRGKSTSVNKYQNPKLEKKIQQQKLHSHVYLKGLKLIDQDMDIIIKEAIINKQCTCLYLSSNKITSISASSLAQALNNNNTLERLYLSDNQIGDDGVYSIVNILSINNNILKRLNLAKNGITQVGAKYLAQMIKINKTLTHLYLGENNINDYGIQLLTDAIQNSNTSIKYLDLSSNKFLTDKSIDSLIQMVKNNQSLNKLYLYNSNFSQEGKQMLKTLEQSKKNFKVCVNSFFD